MAYLDIHRALLGFVLASTLTWAAPDVFPAPRTREEALAGLEDAVTERRAEAVAWLAAHGRMADQPPLLKRLRDEDAFAEGWNKRATVYYLSADFKRSLADCGEVLKRNPNHFGALSGYGQIYFQLEQYDQALDYWRRALEVNPNLRGVEISIQRVEELLKAQRGRAI